MRCLAFRHFTLALVAIGFLLLPRSAWAETVRFGVHPGFDRAVVNLAASEPFATREADAFLIIEAAGFGTISDSFASGQRIRRITGGTGRLALAVSPGGRRRVWRAGDRLVVDVFDAGTKAQTSPVNATLPAHAPLPIDHRSDAAGAASDFRLSAPALPEHKPDPLPTAVPLPAVSTVVAARPPAAKTDPGGSIQLLPPDTTFPEGSMLIRAGPEVGAAAFSRAAAAHVVFDAALPLDLSALKDNPVYGSASVHMLEAGAHMQMRLPGGTSLRLIRQADGWRVGVIRQAVRMAPIAATILNGQLLLAAANSSSVVVLDDGTTGAKLLVGTQRRDGEQVPAPRRTPEFTLAATTIGVVVEGGSDRLALRAGPKGFTLQMADGPALNAEWPGVGHAASSDASAMTRRFDFPDLPLPMLRNRLHDAMRDAVTAPPQTRYQARLRTAQAMLSLGMDVEAAAALRTAASDEPRDPAARQDEAGLRAIAGWLAGRTGTQEAPGKVILADGTDEGMLWQAALRTSEPGRDPAATELATTWRLALSYPEPLRRALLPALAAALLESGRKAEAAELLKADISPALDLSRARLAREEGRTGEALDWLARISRSQDRKAASMARRQAVELRLAQHLMTAEQAAADLQAQLDAWRGDDQELALRLRAASLLEQSGGWRRALELLRETSRLFPQANEQVHGVETALVTNLLSGDAATKLAPLELVALVAECADLLAENPAASALAPVLVDKLLALDLPERAEPILVRMVHEAAFPGPKAELGLRLAGLRLARGDAASAATALDETQADGLDAGLIARRAMFRAKLLASIGDQDGALRLLATLNGQDAIEQSVAILEQRHDWKAASDGLARLISASISGTGKLSEAQADLVLRLATDLAQAGDMAALRQLRDMNAPRFPAGSRANLLQVLTQSPIRAVADLPRAGEELLAARALPASLGGLPAR